MAELSNKYSGEFSIAEMISHNGIAARKISTRESIVYERIMRGQNTFRSCIYRGRGIIFAHICTAIIGLRQRSPSDTAIYAIYGVKRRKSSAIANMAAARSDSIVSRASVWISGLNFHSRAAGDIKADPCVTSYVCKSCRFPPVRLKRGRM